MRATAWPAQVLQDASSPRRRPARFRRLAGSRGRGKKCDRSRSNRHRRAFHDESRGRSAGCRFSSHCPRGTRRRGCGGGSHAWSTSTHQRSGSRSRHRRRGCVNRKPARRRAAGCSGARSRAGTTAGSCRSADRNSRSGRDTGQEPALPGRARWKESRAETWRHCTRRWRDDEIEAAALEPSEVPAGSRVTGVGTFSAGAGEARRRRCRSTRRHDSLRPSGLQCAFDGGENQVRRAGLLQRQHHA